MNCFPLEAMRDVVLWFCPVSICPSVTLVRHRAEDIVKVFLGSVAPSF